MHIEIPFRMLSALLKSHFQVLVGPAALRINQFAVYQKCAVGEVGTPMGVVCDRGATATCDVEGDLTPLVTPFAFQGPCSNPL